MSWWLVVWNVILTAAIITSAVTFILLLALPTSYSHFHPRYLTEEAFTEDCKSNPKKSGYAYFNKNKDEKGIVKIDASVQIVVLGDIGRSPRMQYHALSIASHGGKVDLIGYAGSGVHPDILQNCLINIVPIKPFPQWLQTNSRILFLLLAPLKVLHQTWSLYHALAYRIIASKWMLVQNPPSIPALAICRLVCWIRNTRLVIDWHNFGYSILALRLGRAHPLVKISEWYERLTSRGVYAHFCVTDAMGRVLKDSWGIANALPLHDRPPEIFQPLSPTTRQEVLERLPGTSKYATDILSGRCRLLVSSTSWTPDEDFSILLDALVQYSSLVETKQYLPNIIAIITGRGPQREYYLRKIEALTKANKLQHVIVTTAWLSPQDYAFLLGSADLGVSLHTSSSGVDLPMKVVDMFGTGLPVAGWSDFEAWPELVKEGENGRGFDSAERLSEIIEELFGEDGSQLKKLREGATKECERRWNDEWMPVAGKLFQLKP